MSTTSLSSKIGSAAIIERDFSGGAWKKLNGMRTEVMKHQQAILQLIRQTSQNFIQIGKHLNAVHELIGVKAFQEWMRENGIHKVSASRCMNAAAHFGDDTSEIVDHI